ncbi:heat-inducible transcriptional repressor HrcA [Kiloniella laminariae]|uniref:Heat-inducible transcription repressor HrcA n=1 Tax=Kiloniella laminariae TaxID=454162 RepID=A0ABT4LJF8_9PROT|nr:heat-inducible transcriptional repressor HrcA [Kiloniella laminariae]MCZ4281244.1 heat-inducible transcriptional repressor HrcA [Kiloniella laminariae]
MNDRSREIFRLVVDAYVETGEPVGSRTLSRRLGMDLSPATIRNVMADLEDMGLLFARHTSAGRLPTDMGLRLYVNGLLEHGNLSKDEQARIKLQCAAGGRSLPQLLEETTGMLSGLSQCAGLVFAPKLSEPLKHIEFVSLGPGRALVVLISDSGAVENRVVDLPLGLPPSALVEASNYLSARLIGRTLEEAIVEIGIELKEHQLLLDELSRKVVELGLASWAQDMNGNPGGALIVRGQAQLLEDINALEDLERVRHLFSALEKKESLVRLLELTKTAEGVQIFIGAENELFAQAGCSVVMAPYKNSRQQVVGAIGVIGPTRIDYARIIPMVDYTAKILGRMIG